MRLVALPLMTRLMIIAAVSLTVMTTAPMLGGSTTWLVPRANASTCNPELVTANISGASPMFGDGQSYCTAADEFQSLVVAIRRNDPFFDSDVASSEDSGIASYYRASTSWVGDCESNYNVEVRIDGKEARSAGGSPAC